MLEQLKTAFYEMIDGLGYNITDNGNYKEDFPWLMVRINDHKYEESFDVRYDTIVFVLDIFSCYHGEKEVIQIAEDILNHIQGLRERIPAITHIEQQTLKIIDDKETGPIKKHGVVQYKFVLTSGQEVEENDTTGD